MAILTGPGTSIRAILKMLTEMASAPVAGYMHMMEGDRWHIIPHHPARSMASISSRSSTVSDDGQSSSQEDEVEWWLVMPFDPSTYRKPEGPHHYSPAQKYGLGDWMYREAGDGAPYYREPEFETNRVGSCDGQVRHDHEA